MAGRFSVEAVFKAIDRISGPLKKMGNGVDKFSRGARSSMKAVGELDVGGAFAKLGGVVAGGAALAGVAIHSVVKSGMDFEQAITNVGAVSLMSRDQIQDLEKKALELGASTKFSATEVANAMEMMGRAGFTNTETLAGIEGVLAAAAAEGGSLAETASTISNVLKGMNLETKESGRVADVLTLASARTNSSITSLGESMKTLGPVAKQFNIPLEETVAMAAMLQDAGLEAGQAGTAAASALTKLAAPTAEAKAQMTKFGVSFEDVNHNMKSAPEIFAEMAKAVKNSNGNLEQAAFFAKLTGLESQKAAISLTNAFKSHKAQDLIAELKEAAGVAAKMAALRMNSLEGDFEKLTGSVESFKISLFKTQSGPLRGLVQELNALFDSKAGAANSGIGKFFQDMKPIIDVLVESFKKAWPPIQKAVQAFLGIGKDTNYLLAMQEFAVVLGKVAALALGLAFAFAGTVVAALQLMGIAVGAAMAAWDWLAAGLGKVLFWIDDFFGTLGAKWRAGGMAAAKWLIQGIVDGIAWGAGLIDKAIMGLGKVLIGTFKLILGIKSPSKVFAKLGMLTAKGFDKGFTREMDTVNATVQHAVTLPRINALSLGTDSAPQRPGAPPRPQVVSPQARMASSLQERIDTVKAEVTIHDETGNAEVTKKPPAGSPVKVRVNQSGQL